CCAGLGCASLACSFAPLLAAASFLKASVNLRTTGASTVEDADLTNSPISLSLAMTTLLSTPNSLASSYTRTFATALPNSVREPAGPPDRRYLNVLIAACSSGAHLNLISARQLGVLRMVMRPTRSG